MKCKDCEERQIIIDDLYRFIEKKTGLTFGEVLSEMLREEELVRELKQCKNCLCMKWIGTEETKCINCKQICSVGTVATAVDC